MYVGNGTYIDTNFVLGVVLVITILLGAWFGMWYSGRQDELNLKRLNEELLRGHKIDSVTVQQRAIERYMEGYKLGIARSIARTSIARTRSIRTEASHIATAEVTEASTK